VHSPLGIPAQGNVIRPHHHHTHVDRGVHSAERLWDALAMLLILSGTTLFLLARSGLVSLANGTHALPEGVTSYVQRADYFSAQSSLGLVLIGAGVATGLGAAIRHWLRRRAHHSSPASPGA
jgi:hypothetical protein